MVDSLITPGVHVLELPTPPGPIVGVTTSNGAFLGTSSRGPVGVAQLVTSWSQYQTLYGSPSAGSYLAYAVKGFFDNGGRNAYVVRVSGTGAVKATATLPDRAGTPINTLTVNALSEGVWGNGAANGLSIEVADGTLDSVNQFRINVELNDIIIETWDNLSMDTTNPQYAPSIINGNSQYITVADLASATTAPNNKPAISAGLALATGAEGATAADTDYIAALQFLNPVASNLNICAPGHPGTTQAVNIAGCAYATDRGDSVFFCDLAQTDSVAQAVTDRAALGASDYGAAYFPWILVSDPFGAGTSPVKYVPPSGHIIGIHARIDLTRGPHKAAAGIDATVAGALGLNTVVSDSDQDQLNPIGVNCIRVFNNIGVVVWGNRTLSAKVQQQFLQTRRFTNFLKTSFKSSFAFAVFEPNDESLWAQLKRVGTQFLTEQWKNRALRGNSASQAFFVKCDSDINPPNLVNQGKLAYQVGFNPTRPAEVIVLSFTQFDGGATITES